MKKLKLDLAYRFDHGFSWQHCGDLHFIGYAFDPAGELLRVDAMAVHSNPFELLSKASGSFACIWTAGDTFFAMVDVAGSFPLFFKQEEAALEISDLFGPIEPNKPFSAQAKESMLRLYCTEGTETLLPEWQTIPAGYVLRGHLQEDQFQLKRWFNHYVVNKIKYNDLFDEEYLAVLQRIKGEILKFSSGRQVVIPLSGGYDSRLLATLLADEPGIDLLCYTYGRPDSPEVNRAREVAEALELKQYFFVAYDEMAFKSYYSESWRQYESMNFFYRSLPHEQDFFALYRLQERGVLKEGFVAIPGYCGDIAGGSFLKDMSIDVRSYIQRQFHYEARHIPLMPGANDWDVYQQWLAENRLSKFIVNSVRVFEHFGGQWMLPLWHPDFLRLFYALEYSERLEQKVYIKLAFNYLFDKKGVSFRKHKGDAPVAAVSVKDLIKQSLPPPVLNKLKSFVRKPEIADPCNLDLLYDMIYRDMQEQAQFRLPEKDYNINYLRAYVQFFFPGFADWQGD